MRESVTALAVVAPFALGLAAGPAYDGDVAFRFQDAEIIESSGLVVQNGLFLTTNDSGDSGRVFAVDPATGETVGTTRWADAPRDVEALAPAGAGAVWVGDIGDNLAAREAVAVTRVPVGASERSVAEETYDLVYPQRPTDAETLLAHPVTGRLYVASKNVFGGRLYAAPARLSADLPNQLRALGRILPIATDGAFFPNGRHLVLRDYGRAVVYTFPELEAVGEIPVPEQQQGEGIAVAGDGTVYVSSEGRRAPVLELSLPDDLSEAVMAGPEPAEEPTAPAPGQGSDPGSDPGSGSGSREGQELPEGEPGGREPWQWVMGGLLAIAAIALVGRAVRPS